MGDIPEMSNYWAVQCGECDNEWIPIRPAGQINDVFVNPTEPFPEEFTVEGHEHNGSFHRSEVRPQNLPHQPTRELPKYTSVK